MPQSLLPFKYEEETTSTGLTALAGLPAYLDLASVLGMGAAMAKHLLVRTGGQGWTDTQVATALVLLQLSGGDCVDDVERLAQDSGFNEVLQRVEVHGLPRSERRGLLRRFRKERKRAVPSASAVRRWLKGFGVDESPRVAGKAWIPEPTPPLLGLRKVNAELIAAMDAKDPQPTATLDQDATLVPTTKDEALFCYKGFKAYQPLNVYWAEHDVTLHSEFRDGNVSAAYQNLRVLQEALEYLPGGVKRVYYRSDSAGYDSGLILYLARGEHKRFGVIEFAISCDVTPAFRAAVSEVAEADWQPVRRPVVQKDGSVKLVDTKQESAEVVFAPQSLSYSLTTPPLRFVAIRECLSEVDQLRFPGLEADQLELPFPVANFGGKRYKLHGIVTNRLEMPAEELIVWHRERCGKSEEVHDVMKHDLGGGTMPSGDFGVNAAWWAIMVLAQNLNAAMKRLVLRHIVSDESDGVESPSGKPERWTSRRLKAIRFHLICLPGRVLWHARQLIIRVAGTATYNLLNRVRRRILCLAEAT